MSRSISRIGGRVADRSLESRGESCGVFPSFAPAVRASCFKEMRCSVFLVSPPLALALASPTQAASALSLTPRTPAPAEVDRSDWVDELEWFEADELDWNESDIDLDELPAHEDAPERMRSAPTVPAPVLDRSSASFDRPAAEPTGCGEVECARMRRSGQAILGTGIVVALGGVAMLAAGIHGLANGERHGLALTIASPHPIWIGGTVAGIGGALKLHADQQMEDKVTFGLRGGGLELRF
jgi:hypothetical protein